MAGGGANSAVWAQIFADVLGRRIVVPAGCRVRAKGAAIVAGVGLGVFESYEAGVDATGCGCWCASTNPTGRRPPVYDDFFGVYRELREATINSWDRLQAAEYPRRAAAL